MVILDPIIFLFLPFELEQCVGPAGLGQIPQYGIQKIKQAKNLNLIMEFRG